jgi:hypothetical protein
MTMLPERLNGAQLVRHDEKKGLTLAWFGDLTCNAFDAQGHLFATWTVNTEGSEDALEIARASLEEKIESGEYPWADENIRAMYEGGR